MADNRNTLTDEILVLAETLGDIKARFERVESEFAVQSRPLEAALAALSAAMTGIKTLQHHVLDNSLSALSLKVEEQRKAIDDQINVIVSELKGADAQNDEKIALQTAELKQQFAEICANVQQLSSQFDAQIKRVELEAKEQITKFAAVTGPQGPAGASFNPKGNWQEGVFYQRLDVVSLLGTSYVSNVDNNASKPTKNSDKWTVLAARAANVGGGGAGNFASLAGIAEVSQGGTGITQYAIGDILYANDTGSLARLPAGVNGQFLKTTGAGGAPEWETPTGGGDVVGPASATDNALVRFDGTSGTAVQNSNATLTDAGALTLASNLTVGGTGTSSVAGVFKAGTDIVTGDTSAFQVHNNVDDKPMVGFYRGGTLRSVLRLNTDNDFRLLSSNLSTPANLTVGNLTASGGSVLLNALTGNPPQFRHHAVGTADIIAGVNGIRFLNNAASAAGMSLDANNDTTLSGNLTVSGSIVNQNGVIQSTLAAGALISSLSTNNNAVHGFQISGSGTGSRDWRLEQGRAGANSFSISNATGGVTTPLIVNGATDNILIGYSSTTSDGGQKLQVNGNATFAGAISVAASAADAKIDLKRTAVTNSSYIRWLTGSSQNWVIGTGATGNDTNLTFYSYDGGGSALILASSTGNATFAGSVKAASQVYAEKSGAGIAGQSVGLITQFTTVNSTTYSVTTAAAKVFVVQLGSGDAALCYTSYKSSTITILGSDGTIVNSNSPSSTQLGIWKGANDHVIYFVTGSNALAGSYGSWGFCFLGNPVISIA